MNTHATGSGAKVAAALQDASLPETHRVVLRRIAAQRERLRARHSARVQALALRRQQPVPADGPFWDRLLAFARLHPVALAAGVGVTLVLGPRRLFRWSGIVLPLLAKFCR